MIIDQWSLCTALKSYNLPYVQCAHISGARVCVNLKKQTIQLHKTNFVNNTHDKKKTSINTVCNINSNWLRFARVRNIRSYDCWNKYERARER